MDIEHVISDFLTIIFSLITFYLFKSFWLKYFEAKGTNQATKEDIGEITEIVENIKSDLIKQTEFLRAELSLTNQHKLNIKTAERDALFDFNRRMSAWIFYLVRFKLSKYNLDNYKDIKLTSGEFSQRQYECDLAQAHLSLFVNGKEYSELVRDLTISVINLENIAEKAMQNAYYTYSKYNIHLQYEKDTTKQALLRNQLREELSPLLDKFRNDRIAHYKNVHDQYDKLQQMSMQRLKQLEG